MPTTPKSPTPKTKRKTAASSPAAAQTTKTSVRHLVELAEVSRISGCSIQIGAVTIQPAVPMVVAMATAAQDRAGQAARLTCAELRGHILGLCEGLGLPVNTAHRARLNCDDASYLEAVLCCVREEGRLPAGPDEADLDVDEFAVAVANAAVAAMSPGWDRDGETHPEEAQVGEATCPKTVKGAGGPVPCCLRADHKLRCCANVRRPN